MQLLFSLFPSNLIFLSVKNKGTLVNAKIGKDKNDFSFHNLIPLSIMYFFILRWLITPFRDNGHLTDDQKKFNKILSSLRQVVERSIGLLKGRWRKLLDIDHLDVVFATKVIMAACVMHNFCLIYDDFDESYFLPNCGEDDDNDGADDGRGPRMAQLKRNRLMNTVCH